MVQFRRLEVTNLDVPWIETEFGLTDNFLYYRYKLVNIISERYSKLKP